MNKELCEACKLIEEINIGKQVAAPIGLGKIRLSPTATDRGIAFLLKDKCECVKLVELKYIKDWGSYTKYHNPSGKPELNFVALYDKDRSNFVVEYYNEKGNMVEISDIGYMTD